ncbi:MAG: ribosomal RNA small subunit methyltransferase A [Saprospiraceae bacterium]|nr:ribosomal RNA small subunit methyltransferase A [Saprospiraceae bacterium]
MKAKKSLGQHFLIQPAIASRIANSLINMDGVEQVVEVGPGKGMLTQFLLELYPTLIMIETDRDMIELLSERFEHQGKQIIHANFLKIDLKSLVKKPFSLIGNFPYNISSQILFKMLDNRPLIPQMVGMFQKEVAQRVASGHGSKTYGILSVLMQTFYTVEYLFSVAPGSFSPPPKVTSAVIRLVARPVQIEPSLEKMLRNVVKLAFGQRRKMLRNSIKSLWTGILPPDDPSLNKRPEQLSVTDFLELSRRLISLQGIQ